MITNYTELKSAIADWLLRDDLTSVIPTFISLSEAQIQREVRDFRMVKRATAQIDSGYSAVPADWLQNIRFQLNTDPITTLEYVTPDQAAEEAHLYPGSRRPAFFTMIGEEFQVVPDIRRRADVLCEGARAVRQQRHKLAADRGARHLPARRAFAGRALLERRSANWRLGQPLPEGD